MQAPETIPKLWELNPTSRNSVWKFWLTVSVDAVVVTVSVSVEAVSVVIAEVTVRYTGNRISQTKLRPEIVIDRYGEECETRNRGHRRTFLPVAVESLGVIVNLKKELQSNLCDT